MARTNGSIVRRGPDIYRVRVEGPPDPATGLRQRFSVTVRGDRAAAEAERIRLLHEKNRGREEMRKLRASVGPRGAPTQRQRGEGPPGSHGGRRR